MRAYTALIMGHWLMDRRNQAVLVLKEALEAFPGNPDLEAMKPKEQ